MLERMDDPLSTTGNHLTREIKAAFCDAATGQNGLERSIAFRRSTTGAAGLGSRDVRAGDIIAIFDNMIERDAGLLLRRHRPCLGAGRTEEDPDLRPSPARSRCEAIRWAASAR